MDNVKYKQIAEVAGVSASSVTRFFDKDSKVRVEISKKITKAIKELRVSLPFEKIIGLIIPDANNPYFTSIAFEFEKEFEKHGWHLLISNSEGSLSRDFNIIDRYNGLGISGLLYINSGNETSELFSSLVANYNDLPVLSFDRSLESRHIDFVVIDSKKGTLQSVDYLVTKRHKKIAYLKGLRGSITAEQRVDAYVEAMATNKLIIFDELVLEGDYQLGSGAECADRLIEMNIGERPTAIICANDLMAIGLMQRLQKAGWKLPEQLSVIGFDDIPWSKWVYPSLTTIAQPIRILVSKATSMLLKRIEAQKNNIELAQQKEIITPMLVTRESVSEPFDKKELAFLKFHSNNESQKKILKMDQYD